MENKSELFKEATMMAHDQIEQAIVPRESGTIETMPRACSGTDQIMQLYLNVPMKSPLQTLHDIVTHNVAPVDGAFLDQQQMGEEGDDESIVGTFKQMAREADLSPKTNAKGGKKSKKQTQNKELLQPSRIMPRKAASRTK